MARTEREPEAVHKASRRALRTAAQVLAILSAIVATLMFADGFSSPVLRSGIVDRTQAHGPSRFVATGALHLAGEPTRSWITVSPEFCSSVAVGDRIEVQLTPHFRWQRAVYRIGANGHRVRDDGAEPKLHWGALLVGFLPLAAFSRNRSLNSGTFLLGSSAIALLFILLGGLGYAVALLR